VFCKVTEGAVVAINTAEKLYKISGLIINLQQYIVLVSYSELTKQRIDFTTKKLKQKLKNKQLNIFKQRNYNDFTK
jgi:hypothetical protein